MQRRTKTSGTAQAAALGEAELLLPLVDPAPDCAADEREFATVGRSEREADEADRRGAKVGRRDVAMPVVGEDEEACWEGGACCCLGEGAALGLKVGARVGLVAGAEEGEAEEVAVGATVVRATGLFECPLGLG